MAGGIVFVGLVIVGLHLELRVSEWKKPLSLLVIKTVVGFILALLLAELFQFTGLTKTILVLSATLPPSLMVVIFAETEHLDAELAANTLTLALPLSIVVMTVVSVVV